MKWKEHRKHRIAMLEIKLDNNIVLELSVKPDNLKGKWAGDFKVLEQALEQEATEMINSTKDPLTLFKNKQNNPGFGYMKHYGILVRDLYFKDIFNIEINVENYIEKDK